MARYVELPCPYCGVINRLLMGDAEGVRHEFRHCFLDEGGGCDRPFLVQTVTRINVQAQAAKLPFEKEGPR